MVQYCVVPGCKNNATTPGIGWHQFPKDKEVYQKWVIKIRRDKKNKPISKHMRVCSAHFLASDYRQTSTAIKCLNQNAVPSIFPFAAPKKERRILVRQPTSLLDNKDSSSDSSVQVPLILDNNLLDSNNNDVNDMRDDRFRCRTDEINELQAKLQNAIKEKEEAVKKIADLQQENLSLKKTIEDLKSGRLLHRKFTFPTIKENLKTLKYYTGFDNLDLANALCNYISSDEKFSFSKKLSVDDQLLLVLSKLRQNFDFEDLGFRFGIHEKLASKIFQEWINVMYVRLGALSLWPDRSTIFNHQPEIFHQKYPNTVAILDATEIRIEKPSSLVVQSQTYSSYKSTNTLKGLIACDPNGGIMFTSQLYTGNISDKKLVEDSGFYDLLKEKIHDGELLMGDSFMADKGFSITHELESLGFNINIPPLASSAQFSVEEVIDTRQIASCRVYVECAIRRVKCFKILKYTVPVTLLQHINQVWTVCCYLANLRQSINK